MRERTRPRSSRLRGSERKATASLISTASGVLAVYRAGRPVAARRRAAWRRNARAEAVQRLAPGAGLIRRAGISRIAGAAIAAPRSGSLPRPKARNVARRARTGRDRPRESCPAAATGSVDTAAGAARARAAAQPASRSDKIGFRQRFRHDLTDIEECLVLEPRAVCGRRRPAAGPSQIAAAEGGLV